MPPLPISGDLNNYPEFQLGGHYSVIILLDINTPEKHTLCGAEISPPRQVFDLSTSKWGHGSLSFCQFTASYTHSFLS